MAITMRQISVRWIAGLLLTALFLAPAMAYAAMFETSGFPFSSVNMVPDASVSGSLTFNNTTGSAQTAAIEAVSIADPNELGRQMTLTVSDGVTQFYSGANGDFYDFLVGGSLSLENIAAGGSKTYTFAVTFDSVAPNTFQNKTLGFDLCVGFLGNTVQCGQTVISPQQPGSTGGGGNSGPGPLVISNADVAELSVIDGTAIIEWDTNVLATSQVIYGLASGGPYILTINTLPNFGYPLGTTENETKVFDHSVNLTGLISSETYVYRVVSRASPPTISAEHRFTVAFARPTPEDFSRADTLKPSAVALTHSLDQTVNGDEMSDDGETSGEGKVEDSAVAESPDIDEAANPVSSNEQAAAAFLGIPQYLRALVDSGILQYAGVGVLLLLGGWVLFYFRRRVR